MSKLLVVAALGVTSVLASPGVVSANVIYTFAPDAATRTSGEGSAAPTRGVGFSLELTDAAVEGGTFALRLPRFNDIGVQPGYVGDVGAFVRFAVDGEKAATPAYMRGDLDLSLAFSDTGEVTSGRIVSNGVYSGLDLTLDGAAVSGFFGSDAPSCNAAVASRACSESGTLSVVHTGAPAAAAAVLAAAAPEPAQDAAATDVPEPASWAVLGMGLAGLALAARPRKAVPAR